MGVVRKVKFSEISKYQYLRIDYRFINGKEYIFNPKNIFRLGQFFETGRGIVMNKEYIAENEGDYPVYSSQTSDDGIFGYIDTFMFDGDFLTWTTDGAKAGKVSYRSGKFNCTNVCGIAKIKQEFENQFELKFLAFYLNTISKYYVSVASGNPKLMNNVFEEIKIPNISIDLQRNVLSQIQPIESEIIQLKNSKLKPLDIINQVFSEAFDISLSFIAELDKTNKLNVKFSDIHKNNSNLRSGMRWSKMQFIQNKLYEKIDCIKVLGNYIQTTKNGWSPLSVEEGEGTPILGQEHFAFDGKLKIEASKFTEESRNNIEEFYIKQGDFFVSRGNTLDLVALASIVQDEIIEDILFPDLYIKIEFDETDINKEYIAYLFNSFFGRLYFKYVAKGKNQTIESV